MMNCTIFSIYIFLKTYKQYVHVFTDLLCENGLINLCRTSQTRNISIVLLHSPSWWQPSWLRYEVIAVGIPQIIVLWLSYFYNKTWIVSILYFQSQIVFTGNKMTTCAVIIAFSAKWEILFSHLALQWCTSFPPILSSPSLWQSCMILKCKNNYRTKTATCISKIISKHMKLFVTICTTVI